MADLAGRGVNELHVEAGDRLNASFLREGLVDELLLYMAPRLMGSGRDMFAGAAWPSLSELPTLKFVDVVPLGSDLRLRARPQGRDDFLA